MSATSPDNPQSAIAMWSGGDYSLHTQGAKDVIDNATPLALDALERMATPDQAGTFQIADYAAADGGTSVDLHRAVIGKLRGRSPTRPVAVTYTDLPSNDYSALFRMLQGENPNVTSYLDQFENVHVFASATSFFAPIFPPGSVDLGFSATAMHWLSRMPCDVSNHIHPSGAVGNELDQLRARSLADWETILLCRASELKPGGHLVMANLAIDDRGYHMGNTGGVHMFDTMNALWRELVGEGTITEAEYRSVSIPQFYRSLDEFCAPLTHKDGPVYQAGLRLVSAKTEYVPCPYQALYEREGNPAEFARAYVPTTRTWSERALMNSLGASRSQAERAAVTARFFDNFVKLVERNPDGHGMGYIHAYLVVRKESPA